MENEEIGEDIMGLKEKQFWWVFREETDEQNIEDIMQKFKVVQVWCGNGAGQNHRIYANSVTPTSKNFLANTAKIHLVTASIWAHGSKENIDVESWLHQDSLGKWQKKAECIWGFNTSKTISNLIHKLHSIIATLLQASSPLLASLIGNLLF